MRLDPLISGSLILAGLAIGASLASQAGVNAQLRLALSSPVQAAFVSFLIGTMLLGSICLFQGERWFYDENLSAIPWWAWLGGVFGAFNIAMAVYLAPKLGALALAMAIVCGQVAASLLLDHNGWLGYPKIDVSLSRVLGAALLVVGLILVSKR